MAQFVRFVCAAVSVASLLSACSGSDSSGYVRPAGRGSAACQAWQKSICDYVALDCKAITEVECVDNYFGVTCVSDEKAQSCAAALDNATCTTPPAGCDMTDMADPVPAAAACNGFIDAMCQHFVACGAGTLEECVTEAQIEIPCAQAIAYTVTYETCIGDIAKTACTDPNMPAACEDVIKISP